MFALDSPRRRVRTPLILQVEDVECGAACLAIVLASFGRWVPIDELREACAVGRDGCGAGDITRAARKYGLEPTGWRKDPDGLREMQLPMVLHWEFNHFVVLEGFDRGRYFINDPANGHRTILEEDFGGSFTGIALTFAPGADFRRGGTRPGTFRSLRPWLGNAKTPLAFAMACGLLLTLPTLALPILLSVFVDYVLSGQQPSWGAVAVGALLAAGVITYLLAWLRQRCLRMLSVFLSIDYGIRFMRRLFRLPVQFFSYRFAGELTSRMQVLDQVASTATNQLVGICIEIIASLAFVLLMLWYDPLLAMVILGLGVSGVVCTRVLSRSRADENRRLRREQGKLNGIGMSGLRGIDALQANAGEDDFFRRWTGYQARELLVRQQFTEFGHAIASLPILFLILGNAAVLGFGGWRVMSGDMSVGMLMGFYAAAVSFLQPIGRFVQFADRFKMLEADLQRLDDVLSATEDPSVSAGEEDSSRLISTFKNRLRLSGRLELRDVTFGYRLNRPPLVENFSLQVEPGQRVAIVGPSGSGKSTLTSLITGSQMPWSGEILFDGAPRTEIPRELLCSSLALVDQHIFLFKATVRENLTLWDPAAPDQAVIQAGKDAAIHREVLSRDGGYDSLIEEEGRNFSGGQRQRLEIARALVRNPSILILDEATSALDVHNEALIDDALRRRGCTCLIVAHRLSTVRDCDLIIVLDEGREAQCGDHQSLMRETDGLYHRLLAAS